MMVARDRRSVPSRSGIPSVPPVILALALMAGISAGGHADGTHGKWMIGPVPVAVSAAFISPTPVALFGAGFATGVLFGFLSSMLDEEGQDYHGREVTLSGTVMRAAPGLYGDTDVRVRIDGVLAEKPDGARFLADFTFRGTDHPTEGSHIRFRAGLRDGYRTRRSGRIIRGKAVEGAFVTLPRRFFSTENAVRRLEKALGGLKDPAAGLLAALTLGRQWEVDRSSSNAMRRTGTGHLMAISGVHIGSALLLPHFLITLLLAGLGRDRAGWKRTLPMAGGGGALLSYLLMSGVSLSALRATVFIVFYWAATIAGRFSHPFSILGWCVVLLLFMAPGGQPDAALILSAAAVAGILLTCGHPCPRLVSTLKATMGALFFTLPLSVWLAGGISLIAPVCNLFAALVFGIVLIPMAVFIDLFACAATGCLEPLAAAWTALAAPVLSALNWFSDLPYAFIVLSGPGCFAAASAAVAAIIIWAKRDFKLFPGIVLFLAVAVTAGSIEKTVRYSERDDVVLGFPRVGQADAAVLESDGKIVLIDCGPAGRPGRMTELEKYLVRRGAPCIEAVFLTHTHPDHVGGLQSLVKRWRIKVVYVPDAEKHPARWSELAELTGTRTRVVSVSEGDEIRIGHFRFLALGPPAEGPKEIDENARSLQLSVRWGGMTALFTGDAPWELVLRSLERVSGLELIKIPHHGSRTGFPPPGLAAALSRLRGPGGLVAVFPSPPPGKSDLPSARVVEWFEKQGVRCLFSGQGKGVRFRNSSGTRTFGPV